MAKRADVNLARIYKGLMLIGLLALVPLSVLWIQKHGFWGGIQFWLSSALLDPMYATAVADFSLLMLGLSVFMLAEAWPRLAHH